jgi:hypothetical protein
MKDSKQYSQKIKKLFSELKRRGGKVAKPEYNDPIEALVCAALNEYMTFSAAGTAYKKILAHFVDLNDLRVSRTEEIVETLGMAQNNANEIVQALNKVLQAVFVKHDRLSLAYLKEMGKRQAREVLEKLEPLSPFVIDYVVLTALNGHAVPLTGKMREFLRAGEYVHPDADDKDVTSFLERRISASDAYTFYALLHQIDELPAAAGTKTTKKRPVKK